jgi:phage tail-like protein
MSRPLNSDPLRNFRFQVGVQHPGIQNFPRLGFMAVSGLAVSNEIIPYREGGNNTTTRKMPGQSDFGPISLTRGLMASPITVGAPAIGTNEAYRWLQQIFSVNSGGSIGPGMDGNSTTQDFRVRITIDVMAHPVTQGNNAAGVDQGSHTGVPTATGQNPSPAIKARFIILNAWPMGLSYSDLEAGGNAVVIENLTLAHEGWLLVTASNNLPGVYVGASETGGT